MFGRTNSRPSGGVKFAYGTISGASASGISITHNCGFTPTKFYLIANSTQSAMNYPLVINVVYEDNTIKRVTRGGNGDGSLNDSTSKVKSFEVTDSIFNIYLTGATYGIFNVAQYLWIAIGE